MFIVQGVIRALEDPAAIRTLDETYDGLLHQYEGIYWNIYLERLDEPGLTIHAQGWKEQATSEAFGVSDGFQNLRATSAASTARSKLEGPLSPGYWRPVLTAEIAPPPTGYDRNKLGVATHAMVFVRPGREFDYLAAEERIAERLKPVDGVFWLRAYQNRGQPNAYSRIIHWRDAAAAEAAIAALGDAEASRRALIEQEAGGLCQVKLFSDWPDRRERDGVPG